MAQRLDDYSIDKLRVALPMWSDSVIMELLGKIRATYKKFSHKMPVDYELELIRKETIIRKELFYRLKMYYNKRDNLNIQKKLIDGRIEEPFKIREGRG